MAIALAVRWCAECRAETAFEVPPCADGHGADCTDLACTDCGAAVVVGSAPHVLDQEPLSAGTVVVQAA